VIEKEIISPESVALFKENILPKMEQALFGEVGKKHMTICIVFG